MVFQVDGLSHDEDLALPAFGLSEVYRKNGASVHDGHDGNPALEAFQLGCVLVDVALGEDGHGFFPVEDFSDLPYDRHAEVLPVYLDAVHVAEEEVAQFRLKEFAGSQEVDLPVPGISIST